jgi:hypothetical protein
MEILNGLINPNRTIGQQHSQCQKGICRTGIKASHSPHRMPVAQTWKQRKNFRENVLACVDGKILINQTMPYSGNKT